MSAYKVSQQAFDDLLKIGTYTETEWGVNQRDSYLDDIESQFELLAKNPLNALVKDRGDIRKGCFSLSVNEHIIIFRKTSYGARIVRVLHKAMDLGKHV